ARRPPPPSLADRHPLKIPPAPDLELLRRALTILLYRDGVSAERQRDLRRRDYVEPFAVHADARAAGHRAEHQRAARGAHKHWWQLDRSVSHADFAALDLVSRENHAHRVPPRRRLQRAGRRTRIRRVA